MPAWIIRLAPPLLFGLAAAFVLSGVWKMRDQSHAVHLSAGHVNAPETAMTSWAETIMDKNILGLELPGPGDIAPGPIEKNDPTSWPHLGTLTGKTPKVLLRDDGQLLILDQGDDFKGWSLNAVHPQSVTWVAAGKRREIHLWTEAPEIDATASLAVTPAQTWPALATGTKISLSRQEVQPLLADPNSLLQMASFKPFSVDGKVSGFQVLSIRPDSLLHKVGLRNGDVLARINGQALTGPTQLLQAYSGMDRASLVTLDVQRASQMLTYLVEIN